MTITTDSIREAAEEDEKALAARIKSAYWKIGIGTLILLAGICVSCWVFFGGEGWWRKVAGILSYVLIVIVGILIHRWLKYENEYIDEERDRIDRYLTNTRDL